LLIELNSVCYYQIVVNDRQPQARSGLIAFSQPDAERMIG